MRIRTIKPGFFKDEDLAEVSCKARLLAIGLLCLADGEGRLEDRPKRIRAEVFPYEIGDTEAELTELAGINFIERYQPADHQVGIIQVRNFSVHQRITGKEATYTSSLPVQGNTGETTGKHWGNNGETPEKQQGSTRETYSVQEREREREKERERSTESVHQTGGLKHPHGALLDLSEEKNSESTEPLNGKITPIKEIVAAYNRVCTSMPKCRVPTDARKRAIKNLWQILNEDISNVELYFEQAQDSGFLSGRSGKWKACNIDWLCKRANAAKVLEGCYDNERESS